MSHEQAKKELEAGTPADVICTTCPWDRLCVEPPTMSSHEIDQRIKEAEAADLARRTPGQQQGGGGMSLQMLMTAMVFGGKDSMGKLCPVFVLRLRGPDGRGVADGIRHIMRTWGEES